MEPTSVLSFACTIKAALWHVWIILFEDTFHKKKLYFSVSVFIAKHGICFPKWTLCIALNIKIANFENHQVKKTRLHSVYAYYFEHVLAPFVTKLSRARKMFVIFSQPYFVKNKSILAILNSNLNWIFLHKTVIIILLFPSLCLHHNTKCYSTSTTDSRTSDSILGSKFWLVLKKKRPVLEQSYTLHGYMLLFW